MRQQLFYQVTANLLHCCQKKKSKYRILSPNEGVKGAVSNRQKHLRKCKMQIHSNFLPENKNSTQYADFICSFLQKQKKKEIKTFATAQVTMTHCKIKRSFALSQLVFVDENNGNHFSVTEFTLIFYK